MSKSDSLSNLPHYVKVKPNIVMGRQNGRSDLSGGEHMPKIRARVTTANATSTVWIDRALVFDVSRVLDEHASFARVQTGVPRRAGGQDAIHHVHATRHVIGYLFRSADAHE